MTSQSLSNFITSLSSSAPTPGGGGAAALAGALGMACAHMTASLTLGKKKYADLQPRVERLCADAAALEQSLLNQIQADADCFVPLAAAYRIPKEDPGRAACLEAATVQACTAPEAMMSLCCKGIALAEEIAGCCSPAAMSDTGCAAAILRAALESAAMNLFVNTAALQDRSLAEEKNTAAAALLKDYLPRAERLYREICGSYCPEVL